MSKRGKEGVKRNFILMTGEWKGWRNKERKKWRTEVQRYLSHFNPFSFPSNLSTTIGDISQRKERKTYRVGSIDIYFPI